jgi:hypothetical protein
MAGDKSRKSQPGDELLDWWTVSYRTLYLIGFVLLVLAGGAAYYLFSRDAPPPPKVENPMPISAGVRFTALEGSVKIKTVGTFEWVTASKDVVLRKGDLVKTGSGSAAEITFFDGTTVHVRPDSLLTIEESSENPATKERRISTLVSDGEVFFSSKSRTDFTTPLTQVTAPSEAEGGIKVGQSGESDVRIFRSSEPVEVKTKTGETIPLVANETVRVDTDGRASPKMMLPASPALLAPPNQAEIIYPDPQKATTLLAWRAVPGAAAYHFQIDYTASFNRPIKDMGSWKENAVELRGLDVGKYYWRVAAIDKQNIEGNFSDFARFTVTRPSAGRAPKPMLIIDSLDPRTNILQVKGRTEPGATVSVNGQPLDVQADGSFNEFITLDTDRAGPQSVIVRSVSINGGVNEQARTVVVSF